MRVVQINSVCGVGSTGGITVGISRTLTEANIENYILYSINKHEYPLGIQYSSLFYCRVNAAISKLLGNYGFNSYLATIRLIKKLKDINPQVVHLHNMHGHDFNLELFFKHLKKMNVPVIWTLHDCWPFTGYCTHFESVACGKWREGCKECPLRKRHSLIFDRSKELFNKKKKIITAIDDMTIVSPSEWLGKLAEKSYLNKFPIEVINNGIDLDVFKPTESDFRKKHNIENKYMVMGVPKGKLGYFTELSKHLKNDYVLVVVGLTETEKRLMPDNVISLGRRTRQEMAELFTAADVYVNTTLEDTFPTVNLEALACGTPVVTFDTGGSPEAIDETTGRVVPKRNIKAVCEAVMELCNGEDISEACISRARAYYDADERFGDYLKLYKKIGGQE